MIETAHPSDLKQVIKVAKSTNVFSEEEINCLHDDFIEATQGASTDVFKVMKLDDRIVGFVQYGPASITDRTFYLWWIAVDAEIQGRGVGKMLLADVEKDLQKQTARLLVIETSSKETYCPTRIFYLHCGYMLNNIIDDYYADNDGKCIFTKKL